MEHTEAINEILNALANCELYDLSDNNFYECVVSLFKEKYHKPFQYDHGATKGILIFKNYGFVIKIPFSNQDGYDFIGADAVDNWNYCQAEEEKYIEAELNGLSACFAETKEIARVNNYPIYKQEYVTLFDCGTSSHTQADVDKVNSLYEDDECDCFNLEWQADVMNFFGERIFQKLMHFIEDFNITDLHASNLGYIGMRPVILDYSSFNE